MNLIWRTHRESPCDILAAFPVRVHAALWRGVPDADQEVCANWHLPDPLNPSCQPFRLIKSPLTITFGVKRYRKHKIVVGGREVIGKMSLHQSAEMFGKNQLSVVFQQMDGFSQGRFIEGNGAASAVKRRLCSTRCAHKGIIRSLFLIRVQGCSADVTPRAGEQFNFSPTTIANVVNLTDAHRQVTTSTFRGIDKGDKGF